MPSEPEQKEIWLPTSEMNVRVQGETITIWEDMKMEKRKVKRAAGFDAGCMTHEEADRALRTPEAG